MVIYHGAGERQCDPDITWTGCPSARAPAMLCTMPKASGAGYRLSALVERIHQAHRCAYVPTEGKGRGGPMSRDMEGGEMAESDRLVKA
jgi:hypothetical protein